MNEISSERSAETAMMRMPIRTRSEMNLREHWAKTHKRRKEQRWLTYALVSALVDENEIGEWPKIHVTLCRIAPRNLDTDNLAASMKAVRDGVADALERDDGDTSITWEYRQCQLGKCEYAVHVSLKRKGRK